MPTKTPTRATKTSAAAGSRAKTKATSHPNKRDRWSQHVTDASDAMTLEEGVFKKKNAKAVARSLKRSAQASHRRKSDPYRSAMSMLSFYINRGGKNLPASVKWILERAKVELRTLFGRGPRHA